jgi:hypothetical protein
MTENDLRAAFPQITQVSDMGQATLGLPGYVIANRKYAIAFSFDDEKRLASVHLIYLKILVNQDGTELAEVRCDSCEAAPPNSSAHKKAAGVAWAATKEAIIKAELNADAARRGKESLLAALTEKYGNPSNHAANSPSETFVWQFPTTVITLMWAHSEYKQLDAVHLFYTLRKKSPDL